MLKTGKLRSASMVVIGLALNCPAVLAHEETAQNVTANKTGGVHSGTVHGVISDSMCKFDHKGMIKGGHGKDAASCTQKCVSEGAKLVLADKKENTVYTFSNSKMAKAFIGKTVDITGHIDPSTKVVHIHTIKAD